jgi:ADP-ribosyl-[dinitrogen reductase] hydrolase
MKLTAQQSDRAAGVLLGTAAGDALGAGYEFTYPKAEVTIDMIGGGPFDWAPGEWTDDTSMAVAIAEVAATGIDIGSSDGLDAIAAQFIRWYDSKPADIGNQTRAVLSVRSESAAAMADRARAISGRKAGNGSLMRTAPVALSYLDDAEGARSAAHRISSLTHDDPRAGQACELWTHAIRHAVVAGNFDGVRGFLSVADQEVAEYWGPLLDQAETGNPQDFSKNGWAGTPTRLRPSRVAFSAPVGERRLFPPAGAESCTAGRDTVPPIWFAWRSRLLAAVPTRTDGRRRQNSITRNSAEPTT